ncbi:MAG: radical SAM protein [Methanosarcina sp.]
MGNATNKMVPIDNERLFKEIELFKTSSIDEVNILDGTFNIGRHYLTLFKKLIEIPHLRITCQARFESITHGHKANEFIRLCTENRHRVHLEFGLQTIHENEMLTIGRKNRIKRIKEAMQILRDRNIDYETSIIYAIPGQTPESFIDTIEFLIENGCKVIKAYPLQIPKNSEMEDRRREYSVEEIRDKFNVKSVASTFSFLKEHREDMDRIASRLNSGQIVDQKSAKQDFEKFNKISKSNYLWKVSSLDPSEILPEIKQRIQVDFIDPTLNNISQEDFSQRTLLESTLIYFNTDQEFLNLVSDIISGNQWFELRKPIFKIEDIFPDINKSKFNNPVQDLVPKKYTCNLLLSKSGNFYVTRDIVTTP